MARKINQLTALRIQRIKGRGLYPDGSGLYLQVSGTSKSWIYRYMLDGRERYMGLGSYPIIGLAEARTKVAAQRKLKQDGVDPIDARQAQKRNAKIQAASTVTFKAAAEKYLATHSPSWKNKVHIRQWSTTLEHYVYPALGSETVGAIDLDLVLSVLEPIWRSKTETASRVRQRIETILDWASAHNYRQGENPARWRGHLDKLLPRRSQIRTVRHQPALPYLQIGKFVEALRHQKGIAPLALELLILTASRTNEVIGARWSEFDLTHGVWSVPASRTKTGREHRVPLSARALALLNRLYSTASNEVVFSASAVGHPLSNNALLSVLTRMNQSSYTVHGFRSTFRDWASERTSHSSEAIEMALGHSIRNKVEAAYRRGDLFLKRQTLMEDWARYCSNSSSSTVVVSYEPSSASAVRREAL
jgi:integrase